MSSKHLVDGSVYIHQALDSDAEAEEETLQSKKTDSSSI
jgi:hypothetical protein